MLSKHNTKRKAENAARIITNVDTGLELIEAKKMTIIEKKI